MLRKRMLFCPICQRSDKYCLYFQLRGKHHWEETGIQTALDVRNVIKYCHQDNMQRYLDLTLCTLSYGRSMIIAVTVFGLITYIIKNVVFPFFIEGCIILFTNEWGSHFYFPLIVRTLWLIPNFKMYK